MSKTIFLWAAVAASGVALAAHAEEPADGAAWLTRITTAARQLNYAGTFVYHHDNRVETSRIWHYADAGGEQEKLEMLDGPPREIVRTGDNVTCYLPDHKAIVVEKRRGARFPAVLPEQLSGLAESYAVSLGGRDRVAGYTCQVVTLEPRDKLRYERSFCADLQSGLLLRARTYNDRNELVESFAFTQLTLGAGVKKDMLKSRFAAESAGWHVDRSALEQGEDGAGAGWTLKNQLPGFHKLVEIRRSISGRPAPVSQIVYSDGLAAVSVFIEPMRSPPPQAGAETQGAINIYVLPEGAHVLTVVGEAPAETVRLIGESMAPPR